MAWALEARLHLTSRLLIETIRDRDKPIDETTPEEKGKKAKAMILDDALKNEYLTVQDPRVLWGALESQSPEACSVAKSQSGMVKPEVPRFPFSIRIQLEAVFHYVCPGVMR